MGQRRDTASGPPELAPEVTALIIRGRNAERQAIEALIGLYQGRIARFVIGQTGDDTQYEDLCQAIFVKMVLGLPRLRSVERFESWLFQIARNACRDHRQARRGWCRLFVPYETAHDAVAAPSPRSSDDRSAEISRGIERLPAAQRLLLRLCLERRRSYGELAELSNSTVAAVKSRLHRARENLREILLTGESE